MRFTLAFKVGKSRRPLTDTERDMVADAIVDHIKLWRILLLLGSGFLILVVLTHVAESFHIFPAMGWGLPNSAGHYLDLVSAILGCAFLTLGFLAIGLTRRKNSN